MYLTPKARRILSFIEGFERLHHQPPSFEDILAYTLGPKFRNMKPQSGDVASRLGITLGRLCDGRFIARTGKHYRTVKTQRTLVLVFNPMKYDPEHPLDKLEPYNVNAPIRDMVTGEV